MAHKNSTKETVHSFSNGDGNGSGGDGGVDGDKQTMLLRGTASVRLEC